MNVKHKNTSGYKIGYHISRSPLIFSVLITVMLGLFLKLDSLLNLANQFYLVNIPSILLFAIIVSFRLLMGLVLVYGIVPLLLNHQSKFTIKNEWISADKSKIIFGLLSGLIFLLLAGLISLGLGIFNLDFMIILAQPDVYNEPDVVGWAYFLLALVPAIWEELIFRGVVFGKLQQKYSDRLCILLSSLFFALFHLSNLVSTPVSAVIGGMVMAFFYGLAWGSLRAKTRSVLPSMIAHYVVDTLGMVFLSFSSSMDPVLLTMFMLSLTIAYPIMHFICLKLIPSQLFD